MSEIIGRPRIRQTSFIVGKGANPLEAIIRSLGGSDEDGDGIMRAIMEGVEESTETSGSGETGKDSAEDLIARLEGFREILNSPATPFKVGNVIEPKDGFENVHQSCIPFTKPKLAIVLDTIPPTAPPPASATDKHLPTPLRYDIIACCLDTRDNQFVVLHLDSRFFKIAQRGGAESGRQEARNE